MKRMMTTMLAIALLSLPFAVTAMDHHEHASQDKGGAEATAHHDDTGHAGHGTRGGNAEMAADGSMTMIGSQVIKGVKGMAHLNDSSATMAKMGMTTTHHLMVMFVDEATGKPIEAGKVAVKITNPDAKIRQPIELAAMDGHFGADIALAMKGEYHFRLGTKLADGEPRKFHFHYVN